MEVINPIIIAGGKQAPSPNTFCEMRIMVGTYSQMIPIVRFSTVAMVSGPMLYILRPGDYTLNSGEVNTVLIAKYGLARGSFKRMYMAGSILLNGTNKHLNFCGLFDKSYDPNYIRGFYYFNELRYERSLIISAVEGSFAAVSLAPLYAAYSEVGLLTLDQVRSAWNGYTTLDLHYLILEE